MGRPGIRTGAARCLRTSALIPVDRQRKKERKKERRNGVRTMDKRREKNFITHIATITKEISI